jgi:ComF family protein
MPARTLSALADLLLAPACVGCAMPCRERPVAGALACPSCIAVLTDHAPRCRRCAQRSSTAICHVCLTRPPAFDRTLVLGEYRPPLDRLIQALKYQGEAAIATALGRLLAERLSGPQAGAGGLQPAPSHTLGAAPNGDSRQPPITSPTTLVTAVPLAADRLRGRGFNQALLIARALARSSRLPLAPAAVARTRPGRAPAGRGPQERAANMAGAFEAQPALVAGQDLLVVDDVITTGATLDAVARALKHAGAASVTNLVIARTPIDHVQCCSGPA